MSIVSRTRGRSASGHSEQHRDDVGGHNGPEVGDEVEAVAATLRVEQAAAQLADRRFELGDPARREGPGHQSSQRRVLRLVHEDHHAAGGLLGHLFEHGPVRGAERARIHAGGHHVLDSGSTPRSRTARCGTAGASSRSRRQMGWGSVLKEASSGSHRSSAPAAAVDVMLDIVFELAARGAGRGLARRSGCAGSRRCRHRCAWTTGRGTDPARSRRPRPARRAAMPDGPSSATPRSPRRALWREKASLSREASAPGARPWQSAVWTRKPR